MRTPVVAREREGVKCGECGAPMKLRWSNKYRRHFYGCSRYPDCSGVHGAHPDGRPLGIPGDRATKDARIEAHTAFDRLWKSGALSRTAAYQWLRRAMALSRSKCHIGAFDVRQCDQVVQLVNAYLGPPIDAPEPSNRPATEADMLADCSGEDWHSARAARND